MSNPIPITATTAARYLAAMALLAAAVAVSVGLAPDHAGAQTAVSTEAELRDAFSQTNPGVIVLTTDIDLEDCEAGSLLMNTIRDITVTSSEDAPEGGWTITQTCTGRRIMTILPVVPGFGDDTTLTIDHLTLTGGDLVGSDAHGGAIAAQRGNVAITGGATLAGNSTTGNGGAIWARGGDVTVDGGSAIVDNVAGSGGGAIRVSDGGNVVVDNSSLVGNVANFGGAISIVDGGDMTVTGSTLISNAAIDSGGGAIAASGGGNTAVVNSTLTANSSTLRGGAISARGDVVLRHTTVVDNEAPLGANFYFLDDDSTLTAFASVVALADGGQNCASAEGVTVTSDGYNFTDDGSCALDADTDLSGGDPLLDALADNGGPTSTRLPQPGSPLIDAIDLADCDPDVATDQRGVARPQGLGCDIGAVEVESDVDPGDPDPGDPDPGEETTTVLTASRARYGLILSVRVQARLAVAESDAALPGQRIVFTSGTTPLCEANTGATGHATCTAGPVGALAVLLNGTYQASFAGDDPYGPAVTSAPGL